jgi:hypothetical protein
MTMAPYRRGWWVPCAAGIGGLISLLAHPCYAGNWQQVGQTQGASAGLAYIDLDSLREEGGFRVATFLTIYATGAANAHNVKLDRIVQETAFDCAKRMFTFLSTVGYLNGKEVGKSADKSDWRDSFKAVPKDGFSQLAYDLVCNSPIPAHSGSGTSAADSPGTVVLPGPSQPSPDTQRTDR